MIIKKENSDKFFLSDMIYCTYKTQVSGKKTDLKSCPFHRVDTSWKKKKNAENQRKKFIQKDCKLIYFKDWFSRPIFKQYRIF